MNILFFDTETTGLVTDWNNPASPNNPRLVQLGMQLCDDKGRGIKTFTHIVKPNGFEIPTVVSEIHGITQEMAMKYGCPLEFAIGAFEAFLPEADMVAAHNFKFDNTVMLGELMRNSCSASISTLKSKKAYCTMLNSTNICLIPQKRGNGYKWPKLREAYMYFFGEELKDAHDALTDVLACKRVFFEGLRAISVEEWWREKTVTVNG